MHKKILTLSLVIFLTSSLSLGISQPLTEQETKWLAKAERVDKNGWIFLHIEGKPYERGFQRGYLTADEIEDFFKTVAYLEKFETAKEINFFTKAAAKLFKNKVSEEYVQEMKGMVMGMEKAGKKILLSKCCS